MTKPPRTVRLKPNRYQPSKAQLEEEIVLRKPDGTPPTPQELARAVLQPVNVVRDDG